MLNELPQELLGLVVKECIEEVGNLMLCCKKFSILDVLIEANQERINNIFEQVDKKYAIEKIHITHLLAKKEVNNIQLDDTTIILGEINSYKIGETAYVCYDIADKYGICQKVSINDRKFYFGKRVVHSELSSYLPFNVKLMMSDDGVILCVDKVVYYDREYDFIMSLMNLPPESLEKASSQTNFQRNPQVWRGNVLLE